jgi:hypothetical protein
MTALERYREATLRNIKLNGDSGTITRTNYIDNGFGGVIPDGGPITHSIYCRIAMEDNKDWHFLPVEQGVVNGQTPFVMAAFDEDIKTDDILEWRGRKYTVGNVTRPQLFGGDTCVQAPLTEIK